MGRRLGGRSVREKLGMFKVMNQNGVSPGANLESEKIRRTFKDFKGTRIVRRERWRVGRIAAKNKMVGKKFRWDGRRWCVAQRGGEGTRNCLVQFGEELGGIIIRRGRNWAGSIKGVPKTASAGDKLVIS